jgi:PPE-repeat protein
MDFALLTPEVNSARMYLGPGSGPMLAAAAAWNGLAAELLSTASSYQSAITGLIAGPWLGPSAASMAATAAPYVAWMRSTAAQAEQTADQAIAAAAAYETAFAETVPPPVVAANRSLLTALVATNFFGQNTSAIAITEAQYAEMWAQDAAAMYGYAGSSASATTLTSFAPPRSSTNLGGQTSPAAVAANVAGGSAGNVQSTVSSAQQALSAVPNALSSLAAPDPPALSSLDLLNLAGNLSQVLIDTPLSPLAVPSFAYDIAGYLISVHTDDIVSGWAGIQSFPGTAPAPPTPFPVITSLGSQVSAGLGEGTTVGALSVPPGWAAAAPAMRPIALALPATGLGAAAEASGGSAGSLFSQMALASMAGRAMAGTGGAGGLGRRERIGAATRRPAEPSPSEPPQTPVGGPITGIAAELRELAALRDSGILTNDEFSEQKRRLLAH